MVIQRHFKLTRRDRNEFKNILKSRLPEIIEKVNKRLAK